MRSTEPRCFKSCSWCLWKALDEEGCMGFITWRLDLQCKSFAYWVIYSLKIKLNCSWKFWRNWNVTLVLLERSWWAGFNGIYLVRFGFRLWEIFFFKWFRPLKIQINSKKPGFGRKISWGLCNTWTNRTCHTSLLNSKVDLLSSA
jgi:hypothetical protein